VSVACSECGAKPAYVPKVAVIPPEPVDAVDRLAKLADEEGRVEIQLAMPPFCDRCVAKLGLARRGHFVPHAEARHFLEDVAAFVERTKVWGKGFKEKAIRRLMEDEGLSRQEAESFFSDWNWGWP
jgi:hypothetical protein